MVTKRKLRKGTCKICGKTFRRETSAELIKAIHAHYLKAHPKALSRRIKKGMKSARGKALVQVDSAGASFWNPSWIGFAERPLIEKVTGMPYEQVKSRVLDFFVQMMLGGVKKP
jgi:hypothetical protein